MAAARSPAPSVLHGVPLLSTQLKRQLLLGLAASHGGTADPGVPLQVIIEKYYGRLTMDFHTNKRICEEVAIIQSKRLRNKIAGFTTVCARGRACMGKLGAED